VISDPSVFTSCRILKMSTVDGYCAPLKGRISALQDEIDEYARLSDATGHEIQKLRKRISDYDSRQALLVGQMHTLDAKLNHPYMELLYRHLGSIDLVDICLAFFSEVVCSSCYNLYLGSQCHYCIKRYQLGCIATGRECPDIRLCYTLKGDASRQDDGVKYGRVQFDLTHIDDMIALHSWAILDLIPEGPSGYGKLSISVQRNELVLHKGTEIVLDIDCEEYMMMYYTQ
jgi:hypothetical protein